MSALPEHGATKDEILAELTRKRARDARWQDGRTFGMVYDGGASVHEVAEAVVLAASAHAAFHKAAHYFGVRVHKVPVRDDWRADVDGMAARVNANTVLVVGSAPQYPQGVIDPIHELAEVAARVGA